MASIVGYRIWYSDGSVAEGNIAGLPATQVVTAFQNAALTGVVCAAFYTDQTYQIARDGAVATENYRFLFLGVRGGQLNLSAADMVGLMPVRRDQVDWYWFDGTAQQFGAGLLADIPATVVAPLRKEGVLLADDAFYAIYNAAKENRVTP